MDEINLSEGYSIEYSDELEDIKVILDSSERETFQKLAPKSKLTRLDHVRKGRQIEIILKDVISKSKSLKLLKDNLGYHIRHDEDLEDEEVNTEIKIYNHLKDKYPLYISDCFNSGMSGDVNRILISKGKLI